MTARPSDHLDGTGSPARSFYRAAFAGPAENSDRRPRTGPVAGSGTGPDPEREATALVVASLPSRLAVAAGAWLLIAPLALSYPTTGAAFRAYWNDVLVGIAVIAVAAPQIPLPARLPALAPVGAVLGGWLAAAPFVLGYASGGGASRSVANDVLVGAVLVLLALLGRVLSRRLRARDATGPAAHGRGPGAPP